MRVPEDPHDRRTRSESRKAIRIPQPAQSSRCRHVRIMPDSRDTASAFPTATSAGSRTLRPPSGPAFTRWLRQRANGTAGITPVGEPQPYHLGTGPSNLFSRRSRIGPISTSLWSLRLGAGRRGDNCGGQKHDEKGDERRHLWKRYVSRLGADAPRPSTAARSPYAANAQDHPRPKARRVNPVV